MHQLSSLRSLSESMHSFRASEPVSHTKNVTMLEDAVIKIMEEEQELNAEIDRLVDLKREIEDERIKPFLRLIGEGLSYSDVMIFVSLDEPLEMVLLHGSGFGKDPQIHDIRHGVQHVDRGANQRNRGLVQGEDRDYQFADEGEDEREKNELAAPLGKV